MEIKKITIVGMGALGILYGNFFTEKLGKEKVEFVANKERVEKYKNQKIYCNNKLCNFSIVSTDDENAADLLIFAVKANSLASAIETVKNKVSKNTIIISLLNGIFSEKIIAKTYGDKNIVHAVAQGMDAVKTDNRLNYVNMGQICIGIMEKSEEKLKNLNAVVNLFDSIGLPYTLEKDIKHRVWSKFMLNVGVNQSVMIFEGNFGTVQKNGEARDLMLAAMREVIPLAEKENVNLTEEDVKEYVDLIDSISPEGMPSMRQDGLARRYSEVELFSGTVIRLGKKHRIETPVNQKIYETIKNMESKN